MTSATYSAIQRNRAEYSGEQELPTLYGALGIIGRRWYWPLLVGLICAGAIFASTQLMRLKYSAEGTLALDRASFTIPEVQAIRSDQSFDPATPRTEVWALLSPEVLGVVVERLNLGSNPDYVPSLRKNRQLTAEQVRSEAIETLRADINAFNDIQSYALVIRAESYDAHLSVDIVNTILDAYQEMQSRRRTDRLERSAGFLSDRRAELMTQVEETNRKLQDAAGRSNQVRVQEGLVAARRLDSLSEERQQLQMRVDQTIGEIAMAKTALSENAGIARLSAVLESPALDRLGKLEAELLTEQAGLSSTVGPLHPQQVVVRERLTEVRTAARQTAASELSAREARLNTLRNRITLINDQIQQMTNVAADATREQSETVRLERDLISKQEQLDRYDERLAQTAASIGADVSDVIVAARPMLKSEPSSPKIKLLVAFGGVVGMLLGASMALVRSSFTNRFESADEIRRSVGLRPLAAVPRVRMRNVRGGPPLAALVASNRQHPAVESLRSLVISLIDQNSSDVWGAAPFGQGRSDNLAVSTKNFRRGRVIALASAVAGSGKTSLCLALGRTAAQEGFRTLVIECDLRRPRIHTLPDWEEDSASFANGLFTLKRDTLSNMYGITAGCYNDNERGLRHVAYQVHQMVDAARQRFDLVLLDTPPVLAVADAEAFTRQSDGTIMVVDRRQDRRHQVRTAVDRLSASSNPVLGFIFNGARTGSLDRYGYSGYAEDKPQTAFRVAELAR